MRPSSSSLAQIVSWYARYHCARFSPPNAGPPDANKWCRSLKSKTMPRLIYVSAGPPLIGTVKNASVPIVSLPNSCR
jgi:hypothetical protein